MNTKKKQSMTQITRHIIQLLSFILIPELFIMTWSSIGTIYKAIITGTFTLSTMLSPILILVAVMPITILWGRFFCGYMCAFGSMQEFIGFIAKKLKIKQATISPKTDKILKYTKYLIIVVLIALWTFDITLGTFSLWDIFGLYSSPKGWSEIGSLFTFGGFSLLTIIILSLFVERGFCTYFCPLGGIFTIVSKLRLFNIKKHKDTCIECDLCTKSCPMRIKVNDEMNTYGKVVSGECIDCFNCVTICPTNATFAPHKEAISGTVAAAAIAGIYFAGTLMPLSDSSVDSSSSVAVTQGEYIDGTYTGTGTGYRGETKVTVKISNGNISSITVDSFDDDSKFFNRAKNTVIDEIISSQSTNVQAVSGATMSSKGIIKAVANALESASINDELDSVISNDQTSDNVDSSTGQTDNSSSTASDLTNLKDGTYTGTGKGRNGNIGVSVVVSDGKITSITITSSKEDAEYFNRAKSSVINQIIATQSLNNVQAVSGATMSSNGIINAVANALGVTTTTSNNTISDYSHDKKGKDKTRSVETTLE